MNQMLGSKSSGYNFQCLTFSCSILAEYVAVQGSQGLVSQESRCQERGVRKETRGFEASQVVSLWSLVV